MDNNTVIGIDLGTTYSCVGIYIDGKVEIITNDQGNRTTASYVAFTDTERIIGDTAKSQSVYNPTNTIYDSKRLIGKQFYDPIIQKDMLHYPFIIENDGDNRPIYKVSYLETVKKYYAEEISGLILSEMKKTAENYLGKKVTNAVVTVPAYFNDSQRQATKDAGVIAGLNIIRIINEPTAAAIAYGLDKSGSRYVLVYDYGGGTLDTSILSMEDGILQVKATSGNVHLGGEDLDNRIVEYCLQEFAKINKLKPNKIKELLENAKVKGKLKKEAENAKRILSNTFNTVMNIDNFFDSIDLCVTLTRTKFEQLCANEFKQCMEPIIKVINDANQKDNKITKETIDDIVLVGGSTRIPKIRRMIKEYFNKDPKCDINPDEAIAYGAAIQGAILSGVNDSITSTIVLIDVTPLSLGIEIADGLMSHIIKRNTTIPVIKEETFSTYSDNQPSVIIKIYEGERDIAKYNNLLGTFELHGIPPALRGIPKIKVQFAVDANGIMNISAKEETSGISNKLIITNNKGRLTKEQLELMYKDAEKYAGDDKSIRDKNIAKTKMETYLHNARKLISSIEFKTNIDDDLYIKLHSAITLYTQWLENNYDVADRDKIDAKYKEAESLILPIIKLVYK